MRKLVRKSVLPSFSFCQTTKWVCFYGDLNFFSPQHCFSILFPPIGFYATFWGRALGFHVCKNLKKDFFGPMCSCMPIDHRSGINGRDDCLWLKINHLSHSSDKKWKAPWTIFRCAALLAQIQKKWWQLWLPLALKITASESAEQTFEAAEIFPWKQKINELQKPSA